MSWWLLALSGGPAHAPDAALAWHGRLMVVAWSGLVPLAVLLARFFKVLPGQDWPRELDNPTWWHGHRVMLLLAVGLMLTGVALLWDRTPSSQAVAQGHRAMGLVLLGTALLQLGLALGRGSKGGPTSASMRGDHYDMTARRVRFERWHKSLGWAAVVLCVPVTALGLVAADAPRWMALMLGLWWSALALAFHVLQRAGRCVDTYQAIWGPDPTHPGNARAPIGWGVRRP